MSGIRLYDYWRSSASYRLRIAFNLKGVAYESAPINIMPGQDEQLGEAYRATNPQMRVPAIEVEGRVASQSMAILEWLDETHPEPPLLPSDPWTRLQARAFADTIACDIHPLDNLSVLAKLRQEFGADDAAIADWYTDWIIRGFTALEAQVSTLPKHDFLFGDVVTLAEICLVPQVSNAHRFNANLAPFPRLVEVDAKCRELDAFKRAAPEAVRPA